jgi:hypothetical protein
VRVLLVSVDGAIALACRRIVSTAAAVACGRVVGAATAPVGVARSGVASVETDVTLRGAVDQTTFGSWLRIECGEVDVAELRRRDLRVVRRGLRLVVRMPQLLNESTARLGAAEERLELDGDARKLALAGAFTVTNGSL